MMFTRFSVISILIVFFYGCTAGILRVDTVSLNYSIQSSTTEPIKPKLNAEVKVNDIRTNDGGWLGGKLGKLRVGHAENSFGESIAPHIALAHPLEDSFKDAIYAKLASLSEKNDSCSPTVVSVDIEHFYTKFKNRFGMYVATADLRFNLTINASSGVIYTRVINANGESSPSFWQEGKIAEDALNEAFNRGLNVFFVDKDFLTALNDGCRN